MKQLTWAWLMRQTISIFKKIIEGCTWIILLSSLTGRAAIEPLLTYPHNYPSIKSIIEISEENLEKNFFRTTIDPGHDWLSVSQGSYNKQYYTRDTFISFIGGVQASESIRSRLFYSLDWFAKMIMHDGYLPIWVRETDALNTYLYVPYNLTDKTGGIRQLDHMMEFINVAYLNYKKTNDLVALKNHLPHIKKIYFYLKKLTGNNALLIGPYSEAFSGSDWVDGVRRSGQSTFVNALWFQTNKQLAELHLVLGETKEAAKYNEYSNKIKKSFNKEFWIKSSPTNCKSQPFGHYVGWKNSKGVSDYFEVDSNSLAVAVGLASPEQTSTIIHFINGRFDYFVSKNGAARVVCGFYGEEATNIPNGTYQNGAYWYSVSTYLAMAYSRAGKINDLNELFRRVSVASINSHNGLAEWYYENGVVGGASNYSWSLMYPIFLASIIQGTNEVYKLGQIPYSD